MSRYWSIAACFVTSGRQIEFDAARRNGRETKTKQKCYAHVLIVSMTRVVPVRGDRFIFIRFIIRERAFNRVNQAESIRIIKIKRTDIQNLNKIHTERASAVVGDKLTNELNRMRT